METEKINVLKIQIKKVIDLLEFECKKKPTSMLELILRRYKKALSTIENNDPSDLSREMFFISGSVRAYLDCKSDYNNPVLEEMYKTEKLLEQIFS